MQIKLGFIGCGNMATAIIGGAVSSEFIAGENIFVFDVDGEKANALNEKYGVNICDSAESVAENTDVTVLAVKPQVFSTVLPQIKDAVAEKGTAIISIGAGKTLNFIGSFLDDDAKIVRVMPNTPALVLEGMTVISENDGTLTDDEFYGVIDIFNSVGKTKVLKESQINTVIGISSSSPAYVYMLIEAMGDAGVRDGLTRDDAYYLAAQAVLGSAKMVLESGRHPGELKDMVCSPKGTTIEAVSELEKRGFRTAIIEAIKKCNDRAKNM